MTDNTEGRYAHFRHLRDTYRAELGLDRGEANRLARHEWERERQRLVGDVELRADPPTATTVYLGFPHEHLARMVREGLDPSQVGDMSESWSKLANAMARFSDRLNEQVTRSDAVWRGESASIARTYATEVGQWSQQTGERAQVVSHQVSRQAGAAQVARNSMPEPVPFDLETETRQWLADPQTMPQAVPQTLERQRASQDAKAEAVRVMHAYDRDLESAAAQQPVFHPPPRLAIDGIDGIDGDAAAATAASGVTAPPEAGGPAGSGGSAGSAGSGGVGRSEVAAGAPGAGGSGGGPGAAARTYSSMPFHSGGAGPAAAAAGGAGPRGAPGMWGAPGAGMGSGARTGADTEHKSADYLEDWDRDLWFNEMPDTSVPVIGERLNPRPANNPDAE